MYVCSTWIYKAVFERTYTYMAVCVCMGWSASTMFAMFVKIWVYSRVKMNYSHICK